MKKSGDVGVRVSCTIDSSFLPVTRVAVRSICKSKERDTVLIREVAHMGHLLDAGFEIMLVVFEEMFDANRKNITYFLKGDISLVVRKSDQ